MFQSMPSETWLSLCSRLRALRGWEDGLRSRLRRVLDLSRSSRRDMTKQQHVRKWYSSSLRQDTNDKPQSTTTQDHVHACESADDLPAATSRIVKLNYEEVAVFPLVKPRSCLNVKFRCSMISALRSNFLAYRPGVTRWVHPRVPHEWGVHT